MAGEDETLRVGIEADASDAVRDMRQAADAAASLADSFREIASVAVKAATALTRAEQGVTGTARGSKQAAAGIKASTDAMREQSAAAKTLSDNLLEVARRQQGGGRVFAVERGGNTTKLQGLPDPINYAGEEARLAALSARREAMNASIRQTVQANIAESKSAREAAAANKSAADAMLERQRQNSKRYATVPSAAGRTIPAGLEVEGVRVGASFGQIEDGAQNAARAVGHMRDQLFTARFALHDISNATGVAGAALLAFNALTIKAAADYESAMAAIQRTSGASIAEMEHIQNEFVDLAQTVPAGFQNLAQIGELAGQLNIPSQNISAFTETVAQFVSSTDVATQQAAEAFGRLDALLPDVQGNYNALGSSILNVGVNSVATESAIISTTTQIAAAGAQARFTSDEIIGLAASYASLGIAPEAARGSTIRIFSEISTAVQQGGAELDEFARLAGQSAQEFSTAWTQGDASQVFLDFLKGLQTEGTNAETVLRQLGITGVRDINALLRLSQNLDIVQQSFGYANEGFTQGTQLAEAFGITSETLNARLELLGQSIQALFAELGSTGTGPIKDFVNVLIELIKFMTQVAREPAAQWIAIFGGVFTLLAGGILVITSLVARMGAMAIATRTVNHELREMAVHAATSGTAMGALQSRVIGAGIAMTQFGNIMKGLAWGTAITAGITLAIAGWQALETAFKSSADQARDVYGDFSELSNALRADTEAAEEGAAAYGYVAGEITKSRETTADWAVDLQNAAGSQSQLGSAASETTSQIEAQTFAIGENSRRVLADMIVQNKAIQELFRLTAGLGQNDPQFDTEGFLTSLIANDVEGARAIIDQFYLEIESRDPIGFNADWTKITEEATSGLNQISGALEVAATQEEILSQTSSILGISLGDAAQEMGMLGEESSETASRLDEVRNAVEGAFSGLMGIADWGAAVADLFTGLAESGATSFNIMGAVGQQNLGNLQQAIVTTIIAGETMGVSAAESVGALFSELQARGIDTANLLASLASIPGIGASGVSGIKEMLNGTRQLSSNGQALQKSLSGVAFQATRAARSIGGGGGGGRGLGGAAREATQEIRTLVDYANDLEKVFSRAFEIRFSTSQGMDKITSQWIEMQEAIDAANREIAESQARMQELTADNKILQYFKTVADSYGDSLRSADISAEIAKNNAELAEEQKKAADAADTMNKGLTGNSKAAIENRSEILGLVSSYQDLIAAYASSGMDADELNRKTQELRAQFIQQGLALGYSYDQLEVYAAGFDDVRIAISRVPRNITVAANVNPALQALNEFEARAQQAARNASNAVRTGGGGGYSVPSISFPNAYWLGDQFARQFKYGFNTQTQTWQMRDAQGHWVKTGMNIYKTGGYTGDASSDAIAGLVHGKEFVINAENTQRLGLPFLNALNSGMTPAVSTSRRGSGSNGGIQVVELSATDRALLAAAGNVTLTMDGRVVAQATNGANFVSAKRGSN